MYLWFFMFLSFVPLCQRRRTTESMLCSRACYMLMCCFHYFSLAPPRRRFIIVLHSSMFFPLTNSFECVAVTRETSTFGEGKLGIDNGSRRNIDETLMWWVKFHEKLFKLRNLMKSQNQINCKTFTNLNIFRLNRFIKKWNRTKIISQRKHSKHENFLLALHILICSSFCVNFDIFSGEQQQKKANRRKKHANLKRRREKKCWYPVSMDTRRKKFNSADVKLSGENVGVYTIAVSLFFSVCQCWRDIFTCSTHSVAQWISSTSLKRLRYQNRCAAMSKRRKLNSSLTHMPEKQKHRAGNVSTDTFLQVWWCAAQ